MSGLHTYLLSSIAQIGFRAPSGRRADNMQAEDFMLRME